jgi:hypothetical protein
VRLPAGYVAEHVELLYATTTHRAQGGTVDTAHPLITAGMTRENLYVLASRARERTTFYVATHDLPFDEDDRVDRWPPCCPATSTPPPRPRRGATRTRRPRPSADLPVPRSTCRPTRPGPRSSCDSRTPKPADGIQAGYSRSSRPSASSAAPIAPPKSWPGGSTATSPTTPTRQPAIDLMRTLRPRGNGWPMSRARHWGLARAPARRPRPHGPHSSPPCAERRTPTTTRKRSCHRPPASASCVPRGASARSSPGGSAATSPRGRGRGPRGDSIGPRYIALARQPLPRCVCRHRYHPLPRRGRWPD